MSHHTIKKYTTEKGIPICLHENKFFKMMFNGYYHYLDNVRFTRGVATVSVFENGDLLLVRLLRSPAIGYSLEFPRGGVENNESLEVAVVREFSEETGYDIKKETIRYLGKVAPDTATINSTIDVYQVVIPDNVVQHNYDTEEIDITVRISVAEFKEKIKSGEIIDAITLSSYALFLML